MSVPRAPSHLSDRAKTFWRDVMSAFSLEPAHAEILRRACEAGDRADEARAELEGAGLTVTNKYGEVRPHPCVQIERDARLAQARLLEQLKLGEDPPASRSERGGGAARERWNRRTGT